MNLNFIIGLKSLTFLPRGQDLLKDADYLIPVPLNLFRIVSRRYN